MSNVLGEIVAHKRTEIAEAKQRKSADVLESELVSAPPVRDFVAALQTSAERIGVGMIAEVKKASPSAGLIRADFDPVAIAKTKLQVLETLLVHNPRHGGSQHLAVDLPVRLVLAVRRFARRHPCGRDFLIASLLSS